MAVADLTVGAVIMPIRSSISLYGTWIFGRDLGALYIALQNACLGVSVMGVVVITIDRYLAALHPVAHYLRKSKRVATIVNIFTWLVPFIVWLFLNAVWEFIDPVEDLTPAGLPRPQYVSTFASSSMLFCFKFALPFVIIVALYARIYYKIRTSVGKVPAASVTSASRTGASAREKGTTTYKMKNPSRKYEKKGSVVGERESTTVCEAPSKLSAESGKRINLKVIFLSTRKESGDISCDSTSRTATKAQFKNMNDSMVHVGKREERGESAANSMKAMRTLTFIVVAFVVTWLPNAVDIVIYSVSLQYGSITMTATFTDITRWISFANSLINPVAYAMAQPLIRQTIARMFRRQYWCN
ncbi:5-hydroxytryptamine receptor 1A-like [Diadema antillarum]|uniref:5-hydroxytryptamine receptor 1A-like n=1 Tax=Diadema antillarum TaxID=105358 RepID=UPI003A8B5EBE